MASHVKKFISTLMAVAVLIIFAHAAWEVYERCGGEFNAVPSRVMTILKILKITADLIVFAHDTYLEIAEERWSEFNLENRLNEFRTLLRQLIE